MNINDPYIQVLTICIIIILSYFFSQLAKKTNIPSVLLLILLGVGIKRGLNYLDIDPGEILFSTLKLLGIVGLIMIVLEAALELKLSKEKKPLVIKSLLSAFLALAANTFLIAWIFNNLLIPDFFSALIYALPLSIMSSAIIIPSVANMAAGKKEFLIYESTFSDILGIMAFYFIIQGAEMEKASHITLHISSNILITLVLSFIFSFLLILLFQRLGSQVKFFLLLAILVLLYAIGKLFHLSSLIMILVFGLIINNYTLFFKGKLKALINKSILDTILGDFHIITIVSAFVVRTFFFVVFGMSLNISDLLGFQTALTGIGITLLIYVTRFLSLKMSGVKKIIPELFVAPRGLITILLFYAIPAVYISPNFNTGILLYVILLSSIIMAIALVAKGKEDDSIETLIFEDWEQLDKEIEELRVSNKKRNNN